MFTNTRQGYYNDTEAIVCIYLMLSYIHVNRMYWNEIDTSETMTSLIYDIKSYLNSTPHEFSCFLYNSMLLFWIGTPMLYYKTAVTPVR